MRLLATCTLLLLIWNSMALLSLGSFCVLLLESLSKPAFDDAYIWYHLRSCASTDASSATNLKSAWVCVCMRVCMVCGTLLCVHGLLALAEWVWKHTRQSFLSIANCQFWQSWGNEAAFACIINGVKLFPCVISLYGVCVCVSVGVVMTGEWSKDCKDMGATSD